MIRLNAPERAWDNLKEELAAVLEGKRMPAITEAWRATVAHLEENGDEQFYRQWLVGTKELAGVSWEVFWEWLRESAGMKEYLSPRAVIPWAQCISLVARNASPEAVGLIRSGSRILKQVHADGQGPLLEACISMALINWPAALALFDSLPLLVRWPPVDMDRWLTEGMDLAERDVETGRAYFAAAAMWQQVSFGDLFVPWLAGGRELFQINPIVARAYFNNSPALTAMPGQRLSISFLAQWANLAASLAANDIETAVAFLMNSPAVLGAGVPLPEWAACGHELLKDDPRAARSFFESSPRLLQEATWPEVRAWVERAVGESRGKNGRLAEFMALATRESVELLAGLRQGISLVEEERSLATYGAALFEEPVLIKSASRLPGELFPGELLPATTDGRRVYLPELTQVFPEREKNKALLRMLLVHEMSHLAEGTYQVTIDQLAEVSRKTGLPGVPLDNVTCLEEWLDLFGDYPLIRAVFELVEDARVDLLTGRKYPGLAREYKRFDELKPVACVPGSREAGLASLARLSLGRSEPVDLSTGPAQFFQQKIMYNGSPTVQDSLEVAVTWYRFLADRPSATGAPSYPRALYRGRLLPDLAAINAEVAVDSLLLKGRRKAQSLLKVRPGPAGTVTAYRTRAFYDALKDLLQGFFREEQITYRRVYFYDEWDVTAGGYKPHWCRVGEIVLQPSSRWLVEQTLSEYYGLISTLKKYFALLRPDRFRRYRRQEEGEQEDLDAIVEARTERSIGAPAAGFFIRRDKRLRDVAVAFLLDLSGSTDQVMNSGKSILDIEREAVIIMAEALEVIGDRYALYGFNGEGRHKVNFYIIKEFDEGYGMPVQQRFGGLKSEGLTRLGAAVRHAAGKLQRVEAVVKLLLILSDGRPYDVDYCSEKACTDLRSWLNADDTLYAREDCRMALREVRMRGMTSFCITVDRKGKEYLEDIFGPGGYVVIDDVTMLPEKLPVIYKKLTI
ncbi:hypothetical protein GFC01_16810 [Desulfofundulus thermobenzoicus]|uniref:VWFA domain-containing protein n=1 Tax=Desulfofundulus thermobenzoicus TaxID=29376 RepID=A0A6N7IUU1_9FIRM|nr:hypothetical protein [Desulfofundulus thermobenzoicus]MQL53886.1 hypothetical protein [Desulfofundulus thermobenzoicus]